MDSVEGMDGLGLLLVLKADASPMVSGIANVFRKGISSAFGVRFE
jgi:hypothetical protein